MHDPLVKLFFPNKTVRYQDKDTYTEKQSKTKCVIYARLERGITGPASLFPLLFSFFPPVVFVVVGMLRFYSYSESKVGISQCVGCGNQDSVTFVVL